MTSILNNLLSNFLTIIVLFFIGLSFRFLLQITGQGWIKTTSHTATLCILPIITFFITKTISGNIALSLGMVGALSIVRFRNPVRSPLELTVYFTSITMGIIAAVSLTRLAFFTFSIYLVVLLLTLIFLLFKKYLKKQFFITSFSEGNSLSTLEITSSAKIKMLDESRFLKSINFSNDGKTEYMLASANFDSLKKIIFKIEDNELIQNYQLNEC